MAKINGIPCLPEFFVLILDCGVTFSAFDWGVAHWGLWRQCASVKIASIDWGTYCSSNFDDLDWTRKINFPGKILNQ